ncbi:MAG: universal stress protein [Candidatus Hodarchaeota archaeon]
MSFLREKNWEDPALQRILLPLQGFPAEVHAMNLAFSLAEPSKANIILLHCRERGTRSKKVMIDRLTTHAKSLSKKLSIPFSFTSVARIRASDAILKAEQDEAVDLIILGAARNPKHKHLLGSTARRVTRKSKSPNLVVSSWLDDLKKPSKPLVQKILLPIRKVSKDIAALNLATALKKSSAAKDAEIIALNLTPFLLVTKETASETPEAELARELFMDDLAIFTEETGLQITPKHVATRNVGEGALEVAEQEKVDLIILGSTRKPGRFGAILGRISFQIALNASASVVIPFTRTGPEKNEHNVVDKPTD